MVYSKIILVFLIASLVVAEVISKSIEKEKINSIDCDSHFREVIEINLDMMKEYSDDELNVLFKARNSDMSSCLAFYSNLLAKLDEFFSIINELELENKK